MTPTSTPRPQISPSAADRIQTHARSILEGEGQEDALLAADIVAAVLETLTVDGIWPDRYRQKRMLDVALSTIRKHQAGK